MVAANSECGTPGITPHRLRGTCLTRMSREGVPLPDIQKFGRHKSPLTTLGYIEEDQQLVRIAQGEISSAQGLTRKESK